jgi:hypothetical protein
MNFLAPIFLLGTLAVAVPIIFHLIRRTPTLQRPFSSLMFLTPSPPQLSRRSRLDKILLLLLRCLIIGLVAAAFARPFLRDKLPAQSASTTAKISIVLVDASASMRREGVWKDAGDRVRELVRQAGPDDRFEIALFDRGVRKLLTFEGWAALALQERVGAVEQRMRQATPTWFVGDLGSALIAAAEELNVLGQAQPSTTRQIIVVSDLQEGSRVQNLQGFDWPRGVDVIFEMVEAKRRNNAGLHLAVESESGPASSAETRPLVRVSNSAVSKRDQFRLAWIDPAGAVTGNPIDLQALPGKSRTVRAPERPQSQALLRLVLSGDDESFDNTLFIAAPEPERVEVAFVGRGAPNDPAELLFYLNKAFQETRRRTVSVIALTAHTNVTIPPDIRFVIAAGELSPAETAALRKHLEGGGSGLLVVKNAGAATTIEQLAGAKLQPAREATVKQYAMLEQIDFAHPIFLPFADPRFSDFTKIHFWKHRVIETNGVANVRVLARFDDSAPALLEFDAGTGKLLVLTSGWYPGDSQLALSSKFVPLLYSMLEYAGCFKGNISLLLTGSELARRSPGMSLRKVDGTVALPDGDRWVLDTPGFFTAADGAATYTLGVNVDPVESRTAPLDPAELQKLGVPVRAVGSRTVALIEKERKWAQATEVESRQKFWRWLIVAALVFVLVETWFAARMSRPAAIEAT